MMKMIIMIMIISSRYINDNLSDFSSDDNGFYEE